MKNIIKKNQTKYKIITNNNKIVVIGEISKIKVKMTQKTNLQKVNILILFLFKYQTVKIK